MRLHVFFIFIWLFVEDFRICTFGDSCNSCLFSKIGYSDPYLVLWFLYFFAVQGQARLVNTTQLNLDPNTMDKHSASGSSLRPL